jgi:signal transduction histidine kinase
MNVCVEGLGEGLRTIALYSHIIPLVITLFLIIYALIQTRGTKLATIFFAFGFAVSIWLLGDLIAWGVLPNYGLVYYFWSWLDFTNITFFALGALFFGTLARGRVSNLELGALFLLCVPGFVITVTGNSVTEFYHAWCEAGNNEWLTQYKLYAEAIAILFMLYSLVVAWRISDLRKRIQLVTILGALLLFFTVFSGTEYLASTTGVYEINLYGLFVLPLFLVVMTFAITDLRLFQLRFVGTQVLAYVLIIMTGSQLLFVEDSVSRNLSLVTVAISLFIGLMLITNARREAEARLKIEGLAGDLEKANEQQVVLIHFITHQIKGFVTKSRNIFSMLLEGDFGQLPDTMKPMIEEGLRSDTKGVNTIQEILNAANIKSGKVTYAKTAVDVRELTESLMGDLKDAADAKGLAVNLIAAEGDYVIQGDRMQLMNAIKNLIDNSIKYTPQGQVDIGLTRESNKVRLVIKDTGVGITQEDMKLLFTEGGHGKESSKVNVESTGFGLYIVKNIIEAHNGKVWAESDGAGKGARFIVELPIS